ncbi:MAG: Rrf2 family transcriptional regulator [Proteobacteria bacterium]|nr:Rrf2 family transcriptional regulator [Pseudomonadota bacterium]
MLTMKAKYALRALCALAGAEAPRLQARQIARDARVPEKFLEAILVDLRKAGILDSKRGVRGGHALARPAAQIMIGDVIRVLDGPLAPIPCASVTAYKPCADCPDPDACAVRVLMGSVRDAMAQVLDHRNLAQLAQDAQHLHERRDRRRLGDPPRPGRTVST